MKFTKLSLVAALAASTFATTAVASEIEVSANVGVASDYVWRGMTQTNNGSAVQGGMDLAMGGFYLGAWTSNIANDTEVDGYAGYAGELAGIGYDVGYIRYGYLTDPSLSFNEAYVGLSKDFGVLSLGATYSMGQGTAPDDIAVDASIPVMDDYSLDLGWGDYDTYGTRYSAGLSKSFDKVDFGLVYSIYKADAAGSENTDTLSVMASTGF
ncbi:MAG TPA: hypothetical protein ENK95_02530 [Campylobacterales bacterium]|nr:hypothetical protein [Campylobacterales bacterium]